jgi:hypothetical protein
MRHNLVKFASTFIPCEIFVGSLLVYKVKVADGFF